MDTASASMGEFIQRHNIAHYLELLKTKTDPAKRKILKSLLAEERRLDEREGVEKPNLIFINKTVWPDRYQFTMAVFLCRCPNTGMRNR
jgi:hypothetical protein